MTPLNLSALSLPWFEKIWDEENFIGLTTAWNYEMIYLFVYLFTVWLPTRMHIPWGRALGILVHCLDQCLAYKEHSVCFTKHPRALCCSRLIYPWAFLEFGILTMAQKGPERVWRILKEVLLKPQWTSVHLLHQDLWGGELLGDSDPDALCIRLSDLANKTIGCLVKPGFQMNNKYIAQDMLILLKMVWRIN